MVQAWGVMGIDLALCPIDHMNIMESGPGPRRVFGYSHTFLSLPRHSDLFGDIRDLKPDPLPAGHDISGMIAGTVPDGYAKGERYYGTFTEDP